MLPLHPERPSRRKKMLCTLKFFHHNKFNIPLVDEQMCKVSKISGQNTRHALLVITLCCMKRRTGEVVPLKNKIIIIIKDM